MGVSIISPTFHWITLKLKSRLREYKHWSTGYYALPESKPLQKISATPWHFATNEILKSVDKLSPRKWEKIQEAASEYIGA